MSVKALHIPGAVPGAGAVQVTLPLSCLQPCRVCLVLRCWACAHPFTLSHGPELRGSSGPGPVQMKENGPRF